MKAGQIISGAIVSDAAGSISVRRNDGKVQLVQRADIMRMLYTELYMGKVYVQKIDGKSVVAYMVDEDRETYTFRMELFRPEEFSLKRDQVLFMARGNPTGLSAEAGTDRAELKWFAPYMPVKRYILYVKGPDDRSYRKAGETGSRSHTLKGLRSNTKYRIHVTALDGSGDETLPSNEIDLVTKNIPPDRPVISSISGTEKGGYRIAWEEASDPDGKVVGYKVYRLLDGKTEMLSQLKKTGYDLDGKVKFDAIYVKSLDERGTESEAARVYFGLRPQMGLSLAPSFIYPLGTLADLADFGAGLSARYEISNYFLSGLELGAGISIYYLPGKKGYEEEESRGESIFLMPLMMSAGYAFYPLPDLAVIPSVSAGVMVMRYSYTYFDIPSSREKTVSEFNIDPSLGAGLDLRYGFPGGLYVSLSLSYAIFFEKSENFSYAGLSLGAGRRF